MRYQHSRREFILQGSLAARSTSVLRPNGAQSTVEVETKFPVCC